MSQESLFDASVYVKRAYDNLILAYSEVEREELAMLANAVLRGYVNLVVHAAEQQALFGPGDGDEAYLY